MAAFYRTEGLVFKKEDRSELDRVFSVFTKDFGRVELFGKSIRKIDSKLRSGVEIFSLSDIEFIQGRHRKTLVETFSLEKFRHVKESVTAFRVASRIANLLDHFLRGQERDERLWDLLNETLLRLNEASLTIERQGLLYYYFFWNFITELGYKPELSQCIGCQKKLEPTNLYFSLAGGGALCQSCFSSKKDGIRIRSEVITILRLFINKEWEILCRLKIDSGTKGALQAISRGYALYLLGHLAIAKKEY